jgi:hypothetical protein
LTVREQLQIEVGQKLQVIAFDRRIEFLPIEPASRLRGFLPGISTEVPHEDDRT